MRVLASLMSEETGGAAAQKTPIFELVNALPQRLTHSDRIKNFATEKNVAILEKGKQTPIGRAQGLGFDQVEVSHIDCTDGLRLTLSDNTIMHLRPSGNAPELRCYAEAD